MASATVTIESTKGVQKVRNLTQKDMINVVNSLPVFSLPYYMNAAYIISGLLLPRLFGWTLPIFAVSRWHRYLRVCKFSDDEDIMCTRSCDWKSRERTVLVYNGICALKKCWTKCISVARNYVEKWQTFVYMCCCFLCQATKFLNTTRK